MTQLLRLLILTSAIVLSVTAYAVVIDRVVAVVNNEAITERDVSAAMHHQMGATGKKAPAISRKEAIDNLVQDKLLGQAMGKASMAVNEDDLNRAMRNIMHQYGMTSVDQLRAAAAKQGVSFDQYRENLKNHIRQMKFMNQEVGSQVKISDQDLEDYYRQHMKKFGGTSAIRISEIIFPINDQMSQEDGHAIEEKVKEVMKKVNRNNFRQMAQKYSKGPNAAQGGDMGVVDPKTLPPEIATALIPLKTGDISDPVITKTAIAIVMVNDRSEATDSDFERLKDQIYSILYEQRMQDALKAFVAQLRQNAYVQINE